MVLLTAVNCVRSRGPDTFWRKRRVFKLTAEFFGRRRNCYSIAIRNLNRALQYSRIGRKLKKKDRVELWTARISGACAELEADPNSVIANLAECDVAINRKTLADLAIWEPRTFECLVSVALTKAFEKPYDRGLNALDEPPKGVITRGML